MADEVTPKASGQIPIYDISSEKPIKGTIDPSEVTEAIASGNFSFPKGSVVPVVSPDGTPGTIKAEEASEAFRNRYSFQTPEQQLQQKYGGAGQQAITALEGAGEGATFGLSTAAERALGVPTEDIRGRREANPWTHTLGQGAGVAASLLVPGMGEANVAKEGALAARAINPLSAQSIMTGLAERAAAKAGLEEATGLGASIARGALTGGLETALFQGGDEISKMISQDPNQSLGTAAVDIGLAGILGSGIGAGIGAINPLWKAATGEKLGRFVEDFKNRINEYRGNANGNVKAPSIDSGGGIPGEGSGLTPHESPISPITEDPIQGLPKSSPGPSKEIRQQAANYAEEKALPQYPPHEYVKADPARGKKIADAYEAMEHTPNDPKVKKAYDALINETLDQYELVKKMGMKIDVIKPGMENPYPGGSPDMIKDVKNGHLWFFPTEGGFGDGKILDNPLLRPTDEMIGDHKLVANDVFRIVHDIFGHAKEGFSFGPHGEENAWQVHARMFGDEARKAMTTETRGQNSWVNFGPHGEANKAAGDATVYAQQKSGLLPDWVSSEGSTMFKQSPEESTKTVFDPFTKQGTKASKIVKTAARQTTDKTLEGVIDDKGLPHGAKLADKIIKKLMNKVAAESLGAGTGGAMGALIGHPYLGAYFGEKHLTPLIESVLPGIMKPLVEKLSSSEGLNAAVEYGTAIAKGDALINRSMKNLFKGEIEVLPSHLIPTAKDTEKLSKMLKEAQNNPDSLMTVGGNVGHYLPEHATAMATAAQTASNYFSGLKPTQPKLSPLDTQAPPNAVAVAKYQRQLGIAQQPLLALQHVSNGTLIPEDVLTIKTIMPGLYDKLSRKIMEETIKKTAKGESIPYSTRMGLSMFTANHLDSTMSPQSLQSIQQAFATNKANIAAQNAPKKSTSSLKDSARMSMTANQASIANRSQR